MFHGFWTGWSIFCLGLFIIWWVYCRNRLFIETISFRRIYWNVNNWLGNLDKFFPLIKRWAFTISFINRLNWLNSFIFFKWQTTLKTYCCLLRIVSARSLNNFFILSFFSHFFADFIWFLMLFLFQKINLWNIQFQELLFYFLN